MSYAGTYGPDETCPHDLYWKSCQYCNNIGPRPTPEQIAETRTNLAKRKAWYLGHPEMAKNIVVHAHTITVYDAVCPAECGWAHTNVHSRFEIDAAVTEHIAYCARVADAWCDVNPEEAYVEL